MSNNTMLLLGVFIGSIFLVNLLLKNRGVVITADETEPVPESGGETPSSESVFLGHAGSRPFSIERECFNRFCFIMGATGSGKTVTINNIFKAFAAAGYPIIYVDGKPSDGVVANIFNQMGEDFIGFNCHNYASYDFLKGSPTEITDKIMCLKDEWENDYYKGLAQNILHIAIKFLQETAEPLTLKAIAKHIDIDFLEGRIRASKSPLISEFKAFGNVKKADLMGMYSHLLYFSNSDFGRYFENDGNNPMFSLEEIIQEKKGVYFAIPALQYPEFASSIGKIVVNDIKNTIYRLRKNVLIILDEYSVFAGIQSLNLINQGREFGAHLVIAMQSLTDLPFEYESLLTNANMLIAHRINSDKSAEILSSYFGTRASSQITRKISDKNSDSFEGSFRETREFNVHPDDLKTLGKGETFIAIKDQRIIEKVKIKL